MIFPVIPKSPSIVSPALFNFVFELVKAPLANAAAELALSNAALALANAKFACGYTTVDE